MCFSYTNVWDPERRCEIVGEDEGTINNSNFTRKKIRVFWFQQLESIRINEHQSRQKQYEGLTR